METPYNALTKIPYKGMNVPALALQSFKSKEWATFLQWKEMGFKVKKGNHGTHLRTFIEQENGFTLKENGKLEPKSDYVANHFVVFNREQVEEYKNGKNDTQTEGETSTEVANAR